MTLCQRCGENFIWEAPFRKFCTPCKEAKKKECRQKYKGRYRKKLTTAEQKARKSEYDRSYWQRPEVKEKRRQRTLLTAQRIRQL